MESIEKALSETQVNEIMTKALITVDPATTLFQISKMMEQGRIGAIIVKKDGNPAGIITDRDFAIKVATQKRSRDTQVDNVASYPLLTINQNDSILTAANVMTEKKVRKLIVLDNGNVTGIITSTDLVSHIASVKNN